MSYLLFSKLFCNSAQAPSFSHHCQMIQEGAQNQPLRKKAFNLVSLNPISLSPREHPSCLSRERGRVNCPQQSLIDRAPPVPGQSVLPLLCLVQGTPFSRGYSSSVRAWRCTLPTKQFLGCEQLKLTFSCFCCFDSFSFSFFCFFFAVTFPSTSSPFLFLIEKNKTTHMKGSCWNGCPAVTRAQITDCRYLQRLEYPRFWQANPFFKFLSARL